MHKIWIVKVQILWCYHQDEYCGQEGEFAEILEWGSASHEDVMCDLYHVEC